MKIRIDAKVFEEVVSTAVQALPSKATKPEQECVYLDVTSDSGSPIMTALAKGDGMMIKKATDDVVSEEDGAALIPAKTLLAFLKLMEGEVRLEVDDHLKATLKCGGKRSVISCMDIEDFDPRFFDFGAEDAHMAQTSGIHFASCVNSVLHCIGVDQGRMVLTGIHFAFDAERGICESVGLDGFRMAIVRKPAETNESFNALIPATSAKLIAKIVGDSENVSFRFGHGLVIVEDFTTAIQASLLSGEYINYQNLLVESGKMEAKFNMTDFEEALKLAMVSAADSGEKKLVIIRFDQDSGVAKVSARSETSEADASIPCDMVGEMDDGANEIAFNGQYLLDAIKAGRAYGEETKLMINKAISPMAITPMNRDDYYQLVLPVRRLG